jgi:Ni,Fe-hydrogenase maturation factor
MIDKLKCEKIFNKIISLTHSDYDLFHMADCFIKGYDSNKLREMINSNDSGIVLDAIFIATEIGDKIYLYMEDIHKLKSHSDTDVVKAVENMLKIYKNNA